jgi:hypothetical protein
MWYDFWVYLLGLGLLPPYSPIHIKLFVLVESREFYHASYMDNGILI